MVKNSTAAHLAGVMMAGLVGMLLGAWLITARGAQAQAVGDTGVVTVRELRLVDAEGRVRARLHIAEDGEPDFSLYDQNEQARLRLFMKPDGRPGLRMLDQVGRERFNLSTLAGDAAPYINFLDERQELSLLLSAGAGGAPFIRFWDSVDRRRMELRVDTLGRPAIVQFDGDGGLIWSAP